MLGQTLNLSREPLTIVGVMPEGFRGLSGRADAFVPHTMSPRVSYARYFTSQDYFHNVIATLKPGVDRERAESELKLIATRMAAVVPPRSDGATGRGGLVVPISDARRDASVVRARTYVAVGAILVLLIAGVNLANLVSTRVAARQREFGVRLAVGASRYAVARTVGVEMGLVAIGGFALALMLSAWTRDLVVYLVPGGLVNSSNDYNPIGLRIRLPEVVDGDPDMAESVGGVGDVTYWPPDEARGPDIYQPALQFSHPFTTVMVRVSAERWRQSWFTGSSGQPMFATLRRALAEVDPNLPRYELE